jgi:hypothetical protein
VTDTITLPRAVVEQVRELIRTAVHSPYGSVFRNPYKHQQAVLAALDAALAEPDAIAAKYNELLMAVAQKHPDETRHETALRYITQAENQSNAPDRAQEVKP